MWHVAIRTMVWLYQKLDLFSPSESMCWLSNMRKVLFIFIAQICIYFIKTNIALHRYTRQNWNTRQISQHCSSLIGITTSCCVAQALPVRSSESDIGINPPFASKLFSELTWTDVETSSMVNLGVLNAEYGKSAWIVRLIAYCFAGGCSGGRLGELGRWR